jgi:hypothetical protein
LEERCHITSELLQMFDGFFSGIQKPPEESTAESQAKGKQFIRADMMRWRALTISVTPKGHCAEFEMLLQNNYLKGVGDLMEDWVEQFHQSGLLNNHQTRNMRDKVKLSEKI